MTKKFKARAYDTTEFEMLFNDDGSFVTTLASSSLVASSAALLSGTVGGSAVQLADNAATLAIFLKADDANTGDIFVGFANTVTADAGNATSGMRLKPGQGMTIKLSNSNKIWVIGSAAGQNYSGAVL